jgi:hypothetical protein
MVLNHFTHLCLIVAVSNFPVKFYEILLLIRGSYLDFFFLILYFFLIQVFEKPMKLFFKRVLQVQMIT